jgi:hypothetical protein
MNLFYSKLTPLVELIENNEYCVLLKVKPQSQQSLVRIPGFTGNELMFRLTKELTRRKKAIGNIQNYVPAVSDRIELTTWSTGGSCETDSDVSRNPASYKEHELLKCVCVDYAIPLFEGRGPGRAVRPCLDIRTVYDKYRSPDVLLEYAYRESGECSVYLNGYNIYTGILDTKDGAAELYERLPLLKDSQAYSHWFRSNVADKLRALHSPDHKDWAVRSHDVATLSDLVDPEKVSEYVESCASTPYTAEIFVGGVFSIHVLKNPVEAYYSVGITRPDQDLGTVTMCNPIILPFSDVGGYLAGPEIEAVTIKPQEMKNAKYRNNGSRSEYPELGADSRED